MNWPHNLTHLSTSGPVKKSSDANTWGMWDNLGFDTRWEELQATSGDEYRRLAKELDLWVIEQHPYIWGVRVGSFNVAQPWIVGLNGEMGIGNCGWEGPLVRSWIDSQLKAELN